MTEHTPRLVYDDDCGFCTWCVERFAERGEFELVGYSALSPDQLARLPDEYEDCMHLLTDDAVYSCGAALEEVLSRTDRPSRTVAAALGTVPGSETLWETGYRFGADRRGVFGKVLSSCTR